MVISIIYDTMWLYKTNNDIFHFCENYSFNAHYVIEHKSHWNDTIKEEAFEWFQAAELDHILENEQVVIMHIWWDSCSRGTQGFDSLSSQ